MRLLLASGSRIVDISSSAPHFLGQPIVTTSGFQDDTCTCAAFLDVLFLPLGASDFDPGLRSTTQLWHYSTRTLHFTYYPHFIHFTFPLYHITSTTLASRLFFYGRRLVRDSFLILLSKTVSSITMGLVSFFFFFFGITLLSCSTPIPRGWDNRRRAIYIGFRRVRLLLSRLITRIDTNSQATHHPNSMPWHVHVPRLLVLERRRPLFLSSTRWL